MCDKYNENENPTTAWMKSIQTIYNETDPQRQEPPAPTTLEQICAKYIAKHMKETILNFNLKTRSYELRPGVILPVGVAQAVFDYMDPIDENDFNVALIRLDMEDASNQCSLSFEHLHFKSPTMKDKEFKFYLQNSTWALQSIDVSNCKKLTPTSLDAINQFGKYLTSLTIGDSTNFVQLKCPSPGTEDDEATNENKPPVPVIYGPNHLQKFLIHSRRLGFSNEFHFQRSLLDRYTHTLTQLDLSGCYIEKEGYQFICELVHLYKLVLFDVDIWNGLLCKAVGDLPKTIRHLDISQSPESGFGGFYKADEFLTKIALTLVNLEWLDISGTDLAGIKTELNDIPALNCRVNTPLKYLGLYNTKDFASSRVGIPAKIIGGNKDELQLLNAARVFISRPSVLYGIIGHLNSLIELDREEEPIDCLQIMLMAMERYPKNTRMQELCMISVSHIFTKYQEEEKQIISGMVRRTIHAIVAIMEKHKHNHMTMKFVYYLLCQIDFEHDDIIFALEDLVTNIVFTFAPDSFCSCDAEEIYLMKDDALCFLDDLILRLMTPAEMIVAVKFGALSVCCKFIENRIGTGVNDNWMLWAWKAMWNLLHAVPDNFGAFISENGVNLLIRHHAKFPEDKSIFDNMLGILIEIAQVKHLRPHLMTLELMNLINEGLEHGVCDHNATYMLMEILAYILSDGLEAWSKTLFTLMDREILCEKIAYRIRTWPLDIHIHVHLNSLDSVITVLKASHTFECQLWAAWNLAYLSTLHPKKSIQMMMDKNYIVTDLRPLFSSPDRYIRRYAEIICQIAERIQLELAIASASH